MLFRWHILSNKSNHKKLLNRFYLHFLICFNVSCILHDIYYVLHDWNLCILNYTCFWITCVLVFSMCHVCHLFFFSSYCFDCFLIKLLRKKIREKNWMCFNVNFKSTNIDILYSFAHVRYLWNIYRFARALNCFLFFR